MRPKPPAGVREGQKVRVTCRCGTKLRFTMPGRPRQAGPRKTPLFTDSEWQEIIVTMRSSSGFAPLDPNHPIRRK